MHSSPPGAARSQLDSEASGVFDGDWYQAVNMYNSNGDAAGGPRKDKFSHLLRFHFHDWIILLLLIVLDIILNVIEPYHRYINTYLTSNISYPLKKNTVPFWAVPIIALLLPLAVMSVVFVARRNVRDFHHGILGLLFTIALTGVLTDAIKDAVGRPRPDFLIRCFPNGPWNAWNFDPITGNVVCDPLADSKVIKEGYKSFPSGHTSWSFAGLGYLSWYLAGKLAVYDKQGHTFKLPIVLLPLLMASLVAASRVADYWHHWQDVLVGGLLGLSVATIVYHQHFPPVTSIDCGTAFIYRATLAPLRTMDENNRTDGAGSWISPTPTRGDIEVGSGI